MESFLKGLRTALVLGRVSNLPTVWSNLLAGWILVAAPDSRAFAFLLLGGSLLYIGGMFLNDFCDIDFDARFCPERPIPSGKISRRTVGILASLWFILGFACLAPFGWITRGIALLLIAAIILYDFRHKNIFWAPFVMGVCRFLLYLLSAAAAVVPSLLGYVVPAGIALASYVIGITYLARGESRPEKPARWSLGLLLLPVMISVGFFVSYPLHDTRPLFFCLLLIGWMAWLLIPLWRGTNRSIGRVVSGLLAGIVLVDAIAVAPALGFHAAWFLILFILALLLQRVIPAT